MVAVQTTKPLRLRIDLFSGDPLGRPLEGPLPPARDAGGLVAFPLNIGAHMGELVSIGIFSTASTSLQFISVSKV